MGTLTNIKTGKVYTSPVITLPLIKQDEEEQKAATTGGTLTNLKTGETFTSPVKEEKAATPTTAEFLNAVQTATSVTGLPVVQEVNSDLAQKARLAAAEQIAPQSGNELQNALNRTAVLTGVSQNKVGGVDSSEYAALAKQTAQEARKASIGDDFTGGRTFAGGGRDSNDFSVGKLLGGTVVKGVDQAVGSLTSTLAWLENMTLGKLFPGATDNSPIQALNDRVQQATAHNQAYTASNVKAGGKAAELIDKYGTATVAAIPQAALALYSGGASAAAQGTTAGLQATSAAAQASGGLMSTVRSAAATLAKDPQYWLSFAQVAGPSYDQAKADGADDTRASLYALGNGLLNAAVEVGGGIEKLPAELQGGSGAFKVWVNSMLDEGKEEVVQGVLERGLQNLIYGKDNALVGIKDANAILNPKTAAEEFLGGAVVGGILGGAQTGINAAVNARANRVTGLPTMSQTEQNTPTELPTMAQQTATTPNGVQVGVDTTAQENAVEGVGLDANAARSYDGQKEVDQNGQTGQTQRIETRSEFLHRADGEGKERVEGRVGSVSFRRSNLLNAEQTNAGKAQRELDALGIKSHLYSNGLEVNYNGHTITDDAGAAATVGREFVMLRDDLNRDPVHAAGHEALHVWLASESGKNFLDGIYNQLIYDTAYGALAAEVEAQYFPDGVDMDNTAQQMRFREEMAAEIAGMLHSGEDVSELLRSPEIVKQAWQSLVRENAPNYQFSAENTAQSMAMQAEGNERLIELPMRDQGEIKGLPTMETVDGYGRNTVGAAQAQFPYQEAPSQSVADRMFTEQEMEAHDLESRHQVYSNAQSRADAELMLDTDYEGEVERLRTEEWGPAENVEGHKILENLVEQARKTGTAEDWAKVKEWKKLYDQKGGTEAGQTLQSRAQFTNSAATITAEASDFLDSDKAKKLNQGKRIAVMETVAEQSEALENIADGDLNSLIDLIERNSEIRRTTGLFSKKTSKQMDWALHKIAELYPDAEGFLRGVAASQTRAIYSDYAKVSFTEAAKSLRIQNMLSKIATVMRNFTSNNIFDPVETLSNDVGVMADMVMSLATGQRTTALEKSWASKAKRAGSLEGALKSFVEVGLDANVTEGKYEGTGGRTFKMTGNFLERFLSTWSKYESYTLTTTDEFQKGGIRAEAQESIDKLKRTGKLDADSLNEWADETAKQRTFQNDSVPAELMVKTRDALNTVHVGDVGAGDVLVPFARVPGNLVDQAFNYSPVGAVNGFRQMVQVMLNAKNGNYSAEAQAQAARNIGRGLNGTAMLAGATALALKGLIKVAGSDDKDKEALEKAQGKTGTQWNLSATMRLFKGESTEWQDGDTLMSIGFLEPFNFIIAAGAMIAESYQDDGKLTAAEVADASFSALVQAVLDLPAMSSINDLITTAEYADGDTAAQKAWNTAKDYAAGEVESFLIPNAVRGIATGLDDTVRNRYTGETFGESVKEGVVSGLPVARESLPASLDPFGREKTQTGNTVMNMLNNNLLPGALTKYKETDVEKTLETVYDATGNASVYPDKSAPSSFGVDGEKFTLDAEQKDEFMTTAGATALEIMMDMVSSENFQMMNEQTQSEYLALANEYARAMAKVEVTDGKYEPTGTSAKIAAAEDAGMSAADYIMAKLNSSGYDADGNGSMTIGENAKAIQNSGMSEKEQEIYWCLAYPEWPEKAEEAGVDISAYIQYRTATYGVTGDKDKDGNTIAGSKKSKIVDIINGMNVSKATKDALYLAEGYAESGLKEMPWNKK